METLKFLMITTHFPPYHLGGDAVFVEYLSKELTKRGHEVHVVHSPAVYEMLRSANSTPTDNDADDDVRRYPYRSRSGKFGPLTTLTFGISGKQMRWASEVAKTVKPDVVHWHNTRGFIRMPVRFDDEIALYTSHDYGAICPRSNLLKPGLIICDRARMCTVCSMRWRKPPQIWRMNTKRVLRYPNDMKIITPSQFVANRLSDEGVAVHSVLRNFVPDPGRNRQTISKRQDTLVYIGMLEMHKGLRTLIKAFIMSRDRHGFDLDIIGEGSLKNELIDTVARESLKDRIRIHGFLVRTEAEALRESAAAQIVPSEWLENCPLTILEAFALGIPVVGSDMGGIPEIVGPDSGSRVFRGGDATALAETLVHLWDHRGEMSRFGDQARKAYDTLYRPEIHLTEYMKVINRSI